MTKIQEIENKLIEINDAVFQDLCDAYISLTDPLCMEGVCRSGMVMGKQKVAKGTPDSYFITPDGYYVLLEYTTQSPLNKTALLSKVKEDIDKCADPLKTGINKDQILKMIYCLNSKLDIKEKNELKQYAYKNGLEIDIKSLEMLPTSLFTKASHLAKEFLGVSIDSGQVLPITSFIKRFERSGYATPISNTFISRDSELNELEKMIASSDITILTGPPGVGKTKLTIELFERLEKNGSGYKVFCIDNCHVPIYDDLKTYLSDNGMYVLLIDDANRQLSNVKQIISLLKDRDKGKLHLILTVRDYAFREIESHVQHLDYSILKLEKFTVEQIERLLKSDDFNIQNPDYISRIQEIANGNPRLAIMGAKVAIENNNIKSLNDVSALYDEYFNKALEPEVLNDISLLKTMGLISFFHSVNRSDEKEYEKMLVDFGMDNFEFEDSIIKLEQNELVETSADQTIVRISEQVLGTYFFYKTFFKDPVLNFETALKEYFYSHLYRVKETIIPANNTFGFESVYSKILPFLDDFWKLVKEDHDKAEKFIEMFWLYKQDEALDFVSRHCSSFPKHDSPEFIFEDPKEKKRSIGYYGRDRYLGILQNFYYHPLTNLKHAILIGAEYVTQFPNAYSEWVAMLRDSFAYTRNDESYHYYRQQTLVLELIHSSENISPILRKQLFFDVLPSLMKTSYQVVSGGLKRNSLSFYRYNLHLNKDLKKIRHRIWKQLRVYSKKNRNHFLLFFHEYLKRTPDYVKKIYLYDLPFIKSIMEDLFDPDVFKEAFLVHDFIQWFQRIGIKDESFKLLGERFESPAVNLFYTLTHDILYRKSENDFRNSFQKYNERKEKEIREGFKFKGLREFQNFYKSYEEVDDCLLFYEHNSSRLGKSLDIVLNQAFFTLGKKVFAFLEHIAKTGNKTEYVPNLSFKVLANNSKMFDNLYSNINKYEFLLKDAWLYSWFINLPENKVTLYNAEQFINLYRETISLQYIDLEFLVKFEKSMPDFFIQLLETIYHKNASKKVKIFVYDIFENHLDKFGNNLQLIKKTYLQQQGFANHFDHDFKDFVEILKIDKGFIIDYLNYWSSESYISSHDHIGISRVWVHPQASALVREALEWISNQKSLYSRHSFASVFFQKINKDKKEEAIDFLKNYVFDYHNNPVKMNMVFETCRQCFPDELKELLLYFLNLESSFEVFEKISWTPTTLSGGGDTIFGEIRAGYYQRVHDILEMVVIKPYRFSEHKSYIRNCISFEKRSADQERKRKFMNTDW